MMTRTPFFNPGSIQLLGCQKHFIKSMTEPLAFRRPSSSVSASDNIDVMAYAIMAINEQETERAKGCIWIVEEWDS